MKRIFAALVAVMCMTGMTLVATVGTSSAQEGCAGSYVACPPVTADANGTVTLATGLPEGSVVTVNTLDATGAVIGTQMITVGANGVVTLNLGGAAALSYVDAAGNTVTNTVVVAAAPAAPAPAAPAPVLTSTGPLVTTTTASIAIPKQVSTTAAPKLAVTGGDVATPLLLGGALIAVGGMAIVASKRREVEFTS